MSTADTLQLRAGELEILEKSRVRLPHWHSVLYLLTLKGECEAEQMADIRPDCNGDHRYQYTSPGRLKCEG